MQRRWFNHLDPRIKEDGLLMNEKEIIFNYAKRYGNHWSKVAKLLQGRIESSINNYFYSTIRKNLRIINKSFLFKEKIVGPMNQILKDPNLVDLVFSTPTRCYRKVKKLQNAQISENKSGRFINVMKRQNDSQSEMQV